MRPHDLRAVGGYYKPWPYATAGCAYCNARATSKDHVPPLVMTVALQAAELMSGSFWLVPACAECNMLLSTCAHRTVKERRRAVADKLKRRYAKLLKAPQWTPEDLAELGHSLRASIECTNASVQVIRHRIAHAAQ